jgi:Restriction endonuclease XhoI
MDATKEIERSVNQTKLPGMAFRNTDPQLPFLERPEVDAAAGMAKAGVESRGAVLTRQLDLAGYRVNKPLHRARLLERYNILCRKLAQDCLYSTAAIVASPRTAATTGEFADVSELTGLKPIGSSAKAV